ncbi:hypothetical protein TA3x_003984 [Tundrisphaera sp. TA3]|uniref:hypothetical protein n=1 Tax=Tundrisphaera sp. TA3 TaxID=3435775 RepID=UPI003EBA7B99
MGQPDADGRSTLDAIEEALRAGIRGAVWFPLVALPRAIQGAFPLAVKSTRILGLLALWAALVFGPLAVLDEVDEVFVPILVAWTVMAGLGSAFGVLRLRRRAPAKPARAADWAEAYA